MWFLLVHSPVVGPSTWRWVAEALRSHGHTAVAPNLVDAASTGDPGAFAEAAAKGADPDEDVVVVGHSGAGSVLPLVAGLIPKTHSLVFVDAGVPPCEHVFNAGGDLLGALQRLAVNGVLPAWAQWWDEGVMQTLVRDEARRRLIEEELPRVPVAFFEAPIAAPAGWCAHEGAFLLLSDAYRSDANRAASLGWPVVERLGGHLDIANDEAGIARILEQLAAASAATAVRPRPPRRR